MTDRDERSAVVAYLRDKAAQAAWVASQSPVDDVRRRLHERASVLRMLACEIAEGRHAPGVPLAAGDDAADAVTRPLDP